jgi:hypothetical protein
MREATIALLFWGVSTTVLGGFPCTAQSPIADSSPDKKPSVAAELTRSKLLKVTVMATFQNVRLGDILKELGAQVEMKSDQPLMWTYGPGFPFEKRVSFTCKDESLEIALDRLFTQVGGGTGYVIVSNTGDKHDGWVRLTIKGERGTELRPPTMEEETTALERLTLAKKLLESGKADSAKPLLEVLVRKYAATKAGMEAMLLLGKIDK